jgi:hypothetical protein
MSLARPRNFRFTLVVLGLLAFLALGAGPAMAGNLLVTGHDTDHHCAGTNTGTPGGCHYVKVAVDYARSGAPDPTKPVLILDNRLNEMEQALDKAFGSGVVPRQVMIPRSPQFATAVLDINNYSAILVASDNTCGGCDLNEFNSTPDSDAINARAGDIANFFNSGGGLFVNAGADHGDGNAANGADTFYSFVPIPVGGQAVSAPFTLTDAGKALGFQDSTQGVGTNDDINCCPTHNSFQLPPAGGALQVAETDSAGFAETLFARGTIENGQIVAPAPQVVPPSEVGLPPNKKCVDTRKFSFRLRNTAGRRAVRAEVFVNGKRKKVFTGSDVKKITIKKLPQKKFKVEIRVTSDNGAVRISSRTYKGCKKSRATTRRGGG